MAEQTVETKNLVGIITHLQTWIESLFQDYLKIKSQYDLLNKDFQELNKKYEKVCHENKHLKAQNQHHQQQQRLPNTTTVVPVYQSIVNHNPHQSHSLTQQELYVPAPNCSQQQSHYSTSFNQQIIINQQQQLQQQQQQQLATYQPVIEQQQSTTSEHLLTSVTPADHYSQQQPHNSNQFQYHDPMLMPSYSAQQY